MTAQQQHLRNADTYAACAVAMVSDREAKLAFERACHESIVAAREAASGPRPAE